MAICQPMNIKTENREKLLRAAWVIGLVWILSLGASAPVAFFHAINTIKDYEGNPIQESAWCNLAYDRPSQTWPSLFLTLTLVFFAVPITVLSVLYGVIGYVLYKSCQPLGQTVTYWHVPRSAAASTVAGGTTHQVCFNDAEEAPRPPPPTLPGDDRLRKQIEVCFNDAEEAPRPPPPTLPGDDRLRKQIEVQRVRMLRRKSVIKMLESTRALEGPIGDDLTAWNKHGNERAAQQQSPWGLRQPFEEPWNGGIDSTDLRKVGVNAVPSIPGMHSRVSSLSKIPVSFSGPHLTPKPRVAVVIAFFICWAPFHAQRLLFVYVSISAEWTEQLRIANEVVSYLSGVLYFFNATLNPVLYNVMSKRFRTAFKATVWQFLSCRNCVLRGLWYCGACAFDICTCACIREVIHGFNPSSSYPEEDGPVGMDAECEQPRRKRSCASAEALGVVDCWQQCSSRSSGNKRSNVSSTNNTKGNNPAQQTKRSLLTATGPSEKLHQLRHHQHQQEKKQQQTMIPMSANNNKPATMLGKRNSSSSSGFSSRTLLQRTFPTVAYAKEGIHRSDRHRRFRSGLSPNFSTHRDASHHHRRSHYNNRRLGSGNSRGRHRPAKSEGDDPDLVVDWSLLSRPQPQQQQQQQCSVSSPMLPVPGRARGPMLHLLWPSFAQISICSLLL
ncbi:unnamed protein product [Notodromas monacha]|uniref:G-protein coupled receptors family 1 profile domain-containing protein n=1 Tax=Notodromas monacha TaxID=399045 RepID=A0A7R9GDW5_9CRUS|nr:unnamed protein product [Notodromas monacha]CAG0919133.1 unnamed protein product [Notodromas monacha]